MAVCLDYQSVASVVRGESLPLRVQITVIALLALALAARVWVKHECLDLGYSLADEKERTVALDMNRRELELQHSVLIRRESLESAASQRLKLVAPHPKQIVLLSTTH